MAEVSYSCEKRVGMQIIAGLISPVAVLHFPYRIVIENYIGVQIGAIRLYNSFHLLSFTTVLPERCESRIRVYRNSMVHWYCN